MKNETYEEFVEKFKPKKTTDDCYTPPEIYEAIKKWACEKYGIDPQKIIRPFYPGGGLSERRISCWMCRIGQPAVFNINKNLRVLFRKRHTLFLVCTVFDLL